MPITREVFYSSETDLLQADQQPRPFELPLHLEKIRKEQKILLDELKEKHIPIIEQSEIFSRFIPTQPTKQIGESEEFFSPLTSSPKFIENTTLRSYQIDGVNWMINLHDRGLNAVVADEMGLGKTLQALTWIAYLKFVRGIRGPHLVISPLGPFSGWVNQAKRWCPSLKVLEFTGNKENRKGIKENFLFKGDYDIVFTTFEIAVVEKSALAKLTWYSMIIDECGRIKNENSKVSQTIREFNSQYRLLLTGIPPQNKFHELWSLLRLLLPDIFLVSADDMLTSLGDQNEAPIIEQLQKVLANFLLRRLKAEVSIEIPSKKEVYVECGLSEVQKELYRNILTKDFKSVKTGDNNGALNIVMQLRKCCNHPSLFDDTEPSQPVSSEGHLINTSGKMHLLDQLLKKLKDQNSRVLIFAQMTRMLDILEDYCELRNYEYCRIDGQTLNDSRQQYVNEFNKEGSSKFIFLITTRAGLGIDLTSADTVILYDSDSDLRNDEQAQNTCHRIGQKKPVTVYRLISKGTIEEKIYERAVEKSYSISNEQSSKISETGLMAMIEFGAEDISNNSESTIINEDLDVILSRGEQQNIEIHQRFQKSNESDDKTSQ